MILIKRLAVLVWIGVILGGCQFSQASRDRPTPRPQLIFLSTGHLEQAVAPGDIPEFPLTVSHTVSGLDELVVTLESVEGATWRAALCFEDQCFLYNGEQRLERKIPVSNGKPLEVILKLFIPEEAQAGESATLELQFLPEGSPAATELATIRGYLP
jgi:hypothetical protein